MLEFFYWVENSGTATKLHEPLEIAKSSRFSHTLLKSSRGTSFSLLHSEHIPWIPSFQALHSSTSWTWVISRSLFSCRPMRSTEAFPSPVSSLFHIAYDLQAKQVEESLVGRSSQSLPSLACFMRLIPLKDSLCFSPFFPSFSSSSSPLPPLLLSPLPSLPSLEYWWWNPEPCTSWASIELIYSLSPYYIVSCLKFMVLFSQPSQVWGYRYVVPLRRAGFFFPQNLSHVPIPSLTSQVCVLYSTPLSIESIGQYVELGNGLQRNHMKMGHPPRWDSGSLEDHFWN